MVQRAGLGPVGNWNNTDTTTLYWNAQGQLTSAYRASGGVLAEYRFAYDAIGNRVSKSLVGTSTTWFLYDGRNLST